MTEPKQRPPGTSLRLSEPVSQLWSNLATKMQLSKTAVLTIALRDLAKKEDVRIPEEREEATA